ncbi:UDP-glucose 4-epimerase GalE [Deinococcus peraridilitoris]|uniref:UDP-glucose 4-epimerase n=1 Tax=Deinococcus peraridilitoris (strain DSM 19664 / LMG 22246 / CIP 109416 / KR-200) TaxID=937777 RepID=L0A493_DEIPD|nr:UDP-glucose 4-epimerase GalE [Deinococcus peraridilitoris]AFZ67850.1 UDP-glucose-4-epimerase [Deinococcus peraridilitoris DSM 19664]
MSKLLVTGGAGYIGSHTVRALQDANHEVVVLDNFSAGHLEALPDGVAIVQADLLDEEAVRAALRDHQPDAVVHFAALIEVGESMSDPRRFYRNNLLGSLNLANALLDTRTAENTPVPVVFSSTAAVYGEAEVIPIPEDAPKRPTSVYGETKLSFEHVLSAYDRAYGLPHINLRYFNVSGAHASGEIGEAHPNKTHLIELALLTALGQREKMKIFGTDYPTPDGTCVRDYIHVDDLASAHVLAVQALLDGSPSTAYNVGLGHGFSVKEVLDAADRVVGTPIPREIAPRRPGDPAFLVAESSRIKAELGWAPQYTDLDQIVESAWRWHRRYPHGFEKATR